MLRHCPPSSQNAISVVANLIALALMILGLTLAQGQVLTSVGLLLLAASSVYSVWLGRGRTSGS